MTTTASMADTATPRFRFGLFRERPLAASGMAFVLLLRVLYGIFWLGGAVNKFQRNYMFSDYPLEIFTKRLAELDPGTLPAIYLDQFAIPFYRFVGWFVTWGEVAVAIGLLFGLMTRWAALLSIFIMINFALGGYGDASLWVLGAIAMLFVVFPTGHWLGYDRRLHARHPGSIWFR